MDVPAECELPGAGFAFHDVTNVFERAGQELQPDSILFMEGFTLQDAMSALEIGEPRLDSGLVLPEQVRPPFDPLTPLLPEEICWILDRAMAYETEFHAGNFLGHTVHTLLYIHRLQDIEPDVVTQPDSDPSRPQGLITIVLRNAVRGLLKCCDLAWRELARGGAYDTEDWQSDKCEVSLLEGTPVAIANEGITDGLRWLELTPNVSAEWKTALQARLLLRQSLLSVMSSDVTQDRPNFMKHLRSAREYLEIVHNHPPPICGPDSPATLAFDTYIGRQLQMATPIRIVPVPTFDETYTAVSRFLDGLHDLSLLATLDQLTTWQTVADVRQWLPDPPVRVPYIRSLVQTTFYDGFLVMNKYSYGWMVNQFFYETCGVDYDSIRAVILDRWQSSEAAPLKSLERILFKLITPHFRNLWHNPPRRRRHFMKSLIEWHNLYDVLVNIRDNIELDDIPAGHLLIHLPDIASIWRLSIIRELVLSGFHLELYTPEERPFAYWYCARIIEEHLACLDDLLPSLREGSPVQRETVFQVHFLTALQCICTAVFIASIPLLSFEWQRVRPNFYRRYKWAFRAEYDNSNNPPIGHPDLSQFINECGEILQYGAPIPADSVDLAHSIIEDLVASDNVGGWAGTWGKERMQVITNLLGICNALRSLPRTEEEVDRFDPKVLKWDVAFHPWFPKIEEVS